VQHYLQVEVLLMEFGRSATLFLQ